MRAKEARVLADEYSDEIAKAAMLKVAECDKLAVMARRITSKES